MFIFQLNMKHRLSTATPRTFLLPNSIQKLSYQPSVLRLICLKKKITFYSAQQKITSPPENANNVRESVQWSEIKLNLRKEAYYQNASDQQIRLVLGF